MRLFIGNLPYSVTREDIESALGEYGVSNIDLVRDKLTGRLRGYGFADFEDDPTRKEHVIGIRRIHFGAASTG